MKDRINWIWTLWISGIVATAGIHASTRTFDWLAHLKKTHPRLLIQSSDWDQIRKRSQSDPLLRRWERSLHREADRICRQPPSRYVLPDGKRLLATSRRVLHRVYTLALIY